MSSPDPATTLANWTAAVTTDAEALFADTLLYTQTLGTVFIQYQLLSIPDQDALKAVDASKMVKLLESLRDTASMIEKCLIKIR